MLGELLEPQRSAGEPATFGRSPRSEQPRTVLGPKFRRVEVLVILHARHGLHDGLLARLRRVGFECPDRFRQRLQLRWPFGQRVNRLGPCSTDRLARLVGEQALGVVQQFVNRCPVHRVALHQRHQAGGRVVEALQALAAALHAHADLVGQRRVLLNEPLAELCRLAGNVPCVGRVIHDLHGVIRAAGLLPRVERNGGARLAHRGRRALGPCLVDFSGLAPRVAPVFGLAGNEIAIGGRSSRAAHAAHLVPGADSRRCFDRMDGCVKNRRRRFTASVQHCPASRRARCLVGVELLLLARVHPKKLLRGIAEPLEPALKSRPGRHGLARPADQVGRVDAANRTSDERRAFAGQVAGQVQPAGLPRRIGFLALLVDRCGFAARGGDLRLHAGDMPHHCVGHGVGQGRVVERIACRVFGPLPEGARRRR